jgi:Domain of unknown function (DUF4062)
VAVFEREHQVLHPCKMNVVLGSMSLLSWVVGLSASFRPLAHSESQRMASNPATGRVFVSSTCFDLIDVRAILEKTLRDAGLTPLLSDRPSSDFAAPGDANSIETCLVNLRASERCIVVLSQRSGSSLKSAGFADVTATELEYRTAVESSIPVLFYVRDRLYAEYEAWRKNTNFTPSWSKSPDAERLFQLIDRHKKLTNTPQSNWIWPFQDAVDLSERVLVDLGEVSRRARLGRLAEAGQLARFALIGNGYANDTHTVGVRNLGPATAARVIVRGIDGRSVFECPELRTGSSETFKLEFHPAMWSVGGKVPIVQVEFEALSGDRVRELHGVLPGRRPLVFVPAGRTLLGRSLRDDSPVVDANGAWHTVPLDPINRAYEEGRL